MSRPVITVTYEQPFESRVGEDTVAMLRFSYNPAIIAIVKGVYGRYRNEYPKGKAGHPGGWLADERAWFVEREVLDELVAELEADGYEVRLPRGERRQQHESRHDNPPTMEALMLAELGLLPGAPHELVVAAYRALSKLHHPDLGGDEERMKRLNRTYEWLTTRQQATA